MTDLLSDVDAPSDAELISRVRGGDVAAYGDLFSRHKDAANRLARQLVRGPDSDDLVAEGFAKVLSVLQGGGGPDVAFRAYLLTAVRRLHVDRVRSGQRLQTTDDMTPFDPGVPFQDTAVAGFESGAAAKAFASLPERWQLVLWHLEVEGQKPADIAPLLGMSANSVSALAYRAREGLRQAFLTMHIADLTETDCRWVNEHLGAFIRKGLSKRDAAKVQAHLDDCRRCTAMYLELTEVNSNLAGIIAPLLLGAAASGYLASTGVGATGLLALVSRAKEFVGANTGAVTAAGVAVGVAAAATVAAIALGGAGGGNQNDAVLSDPSVAVTTPVGPSSGGPSAGTTSDPKVSEGATPTAGSSASGLLAPLSTIAASDGPIELAADGAPDSLADNPGDAPGDNPGENPGGNPTGNPTGQPTDEPGQQSAVDLSGTTIDDLGVNFQALGSPALPPTITLRLLSDPSGMTFDPAAGDCDVANDGLSAECSMVSGSGGRAPGTAAMAAPKSYAAQLPFSEEGPNTAEVSITVDDLPNGFELTGGSGTIPSHSYVRPAVDAALSLGSARSRPAEGNVYTLPGTLALSGPSAAKISTVTYTVTGGMFLDDGTSVASVSRPADQTSPTFRVVPADINEPEVSIEVGVAAPYRDTDLRNNAAPADLAPYDISLTSPAAVTGTADAQGDQQFTATLQTDGFPIEEHPLSFELADSAPGDALVSSSRAGDTITFIVRSTSTARHPVAFRVALPGGWTDADITNNTTGTVPWTPAPPPSERDVDVTLVGLTPAEARPGPGDTYTLNGLVDVSGPAAQRIDTLTYTVAGGSFVTGPGCTASECTLAISGAPVFHVVPDDPAAVSIVTITAHVPDGLHDTNVDDNSASATLRRYDVSLSNLVAAAGTADANGDQRFTATLDDDGLSGLTYTLDSDDPTDVLRDVDTDGDTVTFTVGSTATAGHGLSITAHTPTGWTDADTSNNTTQSATWIPAPVDPTDQDVDVILASLAPANARPGPDDTYLLNALVAITGDGKADVDEIRYTIDGGTFVTGPGCTSTECTRPATGVPSFQVRPDDPAAISTVTITAHAPAGFHDTDATNNSASATLRRYDVSLTNLTPTSPTADADGNQQFTADFVSGGLDGVTFTLTDGPSGASLTPSTAKDGPVTFTVNAPATTGATGADRMVPVAIAAVLPPGYTDADEGDNTARATFTANTDVDVAFGLSSSPVRPLADDRYALVGATTLSGPAADHVDTVTYTVTGGSFVDGATASSSTTRPAADNRPEFVVVPANPASPAVTIAASVAAPFHDTVAGNDSDRPVLRRYDVSLTNLVAAAGTADANGDQRFTATLDDDGLSGLTYTLDSDDPTDVLRDVDTDGDTVTFTVGSTATAAHGLSITAHTPTGWTDADTSNNTTQSATWIPAPVDPTDQDVDVILASLAPANARPGPDDTYLLNALVAITGDGKADVDEIRYTIDGGTFVTGPGCTSTECTRPATGVPSFQVRPDDPAAISTVTITAHAPAGFHDTDATNNSASATLRRYDVSLTNLTPTSPTADADGNQQFTATLDDDGLSGLTYTLDTPTAGDSIQNLRVEGTTVTFTVRSASTTAHGVSVTVHLPTGYTDANPTDNTTNRAPWSPRAFDVALGDLSPTTATANAEGDQTFTAKLDRDGYSGSIDFRLSKGSADLSLKSSSVSGDTATFVVHSTKADQGKAPFTVTAGPAGTHPDPNTGNNDGVGTYVYFVTPVVFAFDGAPTATGGSSNNPYAVTAEVVGIPADATTLTLSFPSSQERFVGTTMTGCTLADRSLECPTDGAASMTLRFTARLPGSTDPDRNGLKATAGGHSASTTITFP